VEVRAEAGTTIGPDPRAFFAPGGALAQAFGRRTDPGTDAWEPRAEQLRMVDAVQAALSSGRHTLIEAGTGVGKSLAYLVPLLMWAEQEGKTVAVSTSTIALQEQLIHQDLPLLADALPFDLSVALVKGRGNYLCLRRMHRAIQAQSEQLDLGDAQAQLEAIRDWSERTRVGTRQDLPFQADHTVWEAVRAEPGNCLGRACTHYQECHYQRSRRRAHAARLLVLNHHILLADLSLRRSGSSFLPDVDAIVIDEAHDFEDVAVSQLGLRITAMGGLRQIGRLWSPRRGRGLLSEGYSGSLRERAKDVRDHFANFFRDLGEDAFGGAGARTIPLDDDQPLPNPLSEPLRAFANDLVTAAPSARDAEHAMEVRARARSLAELAEGLEAVLAQPEPDYVRWIEQDGRGRVALCRAPVEVGALLGKVLWSEHHAVMLTSATLTTGRPPSFAFAQRRLGLTGATTLSVGSPFDYGEQVRLRLRVDLPDPVRNGEAFERALPAAVLEAIPPDSGGALVLFTAYGSMRRAVDATRSALEARGLEVLVQGEELERTALLNRLRRGRCVLFGVASFWQGVDVPGEALTDVVITRLPFEVPTHPLQKARQKRTEQAGGDAFRELSLPQAALRLRQGFGRLIRRASDRGTVTILDPRIATRQYGRVLLDSLPSCPVERIEADPF
jgi:ATP-dependent DNA helicase DinG